MCFSTNRSGKFHRMAKCGYDPKPIITSGVILEVEIGVKGTHLWSDRVTHTQNFFENLYFLVSKVVFFRFIFV